MPAVECSVLRQICSTCTIGLSLPYLDSLSESLWKITVTYIVVTWSLAFPDRAPLLSSVPSSFGPSKSHIPHLDHR